jgi:GAF domain-containing protein
MSLDLAYGPSLPETESPIFLAMAEISAATSPAEIVNALRQYILPDADRLSLIQVDFGASGEAVLGTIAVWDRDDLDMDDSPPAAIRELVTGSDPLVLPNVTAVNAPDDPLLLYAENTLQAQSFVLYPLVGRARTVGYLICAYRQPHQFDALEVQAMRILIRQVATVSENFLLLETLSVRTEHLSLINDLAEAIKGSLDLLTLGKLVTDMLTQALPVAHLSIMLPVGPDQLKTITLYGRPMSDVEGIAGTCLEKTVRGGANMVHQDVRQEDEFCRSRWGPFGVQGLIVAPLRARDERFGTFNVGLEVGDQITGDEVLFCQQIASQVAVALENIRLIERLQESLDETTALYSVSLAISAAQTLEEVCATVLSETAHFSQADRAVLYLAGPDPLKDVEYVEQLGVWATGQVIPEARALRQPLDDVPILDQFPKTHSSLLFNDVQADIRLDGGLRARLAEEGVNALLVVPFYAGGTWLGALSLEAREGQVFSEEQVRLCRNVADQTAQAIYSHQLLRSSQQAARREHALREIIERIREAQDVESVRRIASEELRGMLGDLAPLYDSSPDPISTAPLEDLKRQGKLSAEQRQVVESVVDQVELTIQNLNLIERTRRTALREQLVNEVTAQIQRSLSVDQILEATVRTLQNVLTDYDISLRLADLPTDGSGETMNDAG